MSGRTSEQGIPLSKWISSFQTFLDQHQKQLRNKTNNNHTTVSSADYLMPALRLACSLADEICKVGDETGRSPTPSFDWIDK